MQTSSRDEPAKDDEGQSCCELTPATPHRLRELSLLIAMYFSMPEYPSIPWIHLLRQPRDRHQGTLQTTTQRRRNLAPKPTSDAMEGRTACSGPRFSAQPNARCICCSGTGHKYRAKTRSGVIIIGGAVLLQYFGRSFSCTIALSRGFFS